MAKEELSFIISAVDRTKRGLSSSLRNVRGFTKSATRAFTRMSYALARGVLRSIRNVGIALAGFGVYAIKAAGDAEEMENKFSVAFGNMTKSSEDWAVEFAALVGRSRYQVQDWMASFGIMASGMGFGTKAASKFAKQLVALQVDIGSLYNMKDPEVLQSLLGVMAGNFENLKRFGPTIRADEIDKLTGSYMKQANGVKEVAKAYAIYGLLVKKLKAAHNDAAETRKSFTNSVKAALGVMHEFSVEVGTQLIKTLDLAKKFQWLETAVKRFRDLLKDTKAIERFGEKLQSILDKSDKFQRLKKAFQDLFSGRPGQSHDGFENLKVLAVDFGVLLGKSIAKGIKEGFKQFPILMTLLFSSIIANILVAGAALNGMVAQAGMKGGLVGGAGSVGKGIWSSIKGYIDQRGLQDASWGGSRGPGKTGPYDVAARKGVYYSGFGKNSIALNKTMKLLNAGVWGLIAAFAAYVIYQRNQLEKDIKVEQKSMKNLGWMEGNAGGRTDVLRMRRRARRSVISGLENAGDGDLSPRSRLLIKDFMTKSNREQYDSVRTLINDMTEQQKLTGETNTILKEIKTNLGSQ